MTCSVSLVPGAMRRESVAGGCLDECSADQCVAPAPGALTPSDPLFSNRALAPAGVTTIWPSRTPSLTMTVPTAEGPVWRALLPGTAMIEPSLSNVP